MVCIKDYPEIYKRARFFKNSNFKIRLICNNCKKNSDNLFSIDKKFKLGFCCIYCCRTYNKRIKQIKYLMY